MNVIHFSQYNTVFNLLIGNRSQHPKTPELTIIDLFRPIPMMLRTFNLFLQWFSVSMTYFGLIFASATLKLSGNVYSNFSLSALVGVGYAFIMLLLVDKFGRRPLMIGTQLLSGICLLICGNMENIEVNHNFYIFKIISYFLNFYKVFF